MKAQLVVVQGKPEGKVIPLVGPNFKIGRGETCHLRPNSERISREHAEFLSDADGLSVRDLGSRNGTLVNGKALLNGTIHKLKDRDLVQVGPLTFAVTIFDAPAAAATVVTPPARPKASPDDVSIDDIDSWLVGAGNGSTADLPTTVYNGETQTIAAFNGKPKSISIPATAKPRSADSIPTTAKPRSADSIPVVVASAPVPAPVSAAVTVQPLVLADEPEEEQEVEEEDREDEPVDETYDKFDSEDGEDEETEASDSEVLEEFIDESNPFQAAKKAQVATPVKAAFRDTSDAAHDILRKLMQQRKAAK